MRINISNRARAEIRGISSYIEADSLYYAEKTANDIYDKIKLLEFQPYMGRKVQPYNQDDLRELIYKSYRVIYKIKTDHIRILRVMSCYQDLTSNFQN